VAEKDRPRLDGKRSQTGGGQKWDYWWDFWSSENSGHKGFARESGARVREKVSTMTM